MHVLAIQLEQFLRHRGKTTLRLPPRGIVTITGPNRSGKSTLVEGVSFAGWGKTLRGDDPFDENGSVAIETDVATVRRTRKGKRTLLAWKAAGAEEVEYATPTKAQEALAQVLGDFDTWCQTAVFSSADASRWTLATDGDRKRFVEGLLRYDFDGPLDRCKKAGREARRVMDRTASMLADADRIIRNQRQRLAENESVLAQAVPEEEEGPKPLTPEGLGSELAKVQAEISTGHKLLSGVEKRVGDARIVAGATASEVKAAERRQALLKSGRCPTCHQTIPPAMQEELAEDVRKAAEAAKGALEAVEEERASAESEVTEIRSEQELFMQRRAEISAAIEQGSANVRRWEEARRRRENTRKLREAAEANAADARTAIARQRLRATVLAGVLERHRATVATLDACAVVLGLHGVRAQVISKTLAGLEAAANIFLRRIAWEDVAVRLRPYTEQKGGGVADKIAFEWRDGETWRSYKAASGGTRRRLDVAILLALAQVAGAAAGADVGTLFFDEVGDSLDDEGVERLCGVIAELAEDRCIVVISHNMSLIRQLAAVARHRVDDGRLVAHQEVNRG